MVQYVYDAWGNHAVLDANGNDLTDPNHIGNRNPFRYRGYFYDVETGLYYLQTRYYDPEVGRFLNMDDVSYADPEQFHGLNLYAYCGNDPVNRIDPNGNSWWSDFWNSTVGSIVKIIAGVGVIVALGVASVLTGGAILTGAFIGAAVGGLSSSIIGLTTGQSLSEFSDGFLSGVVIGGVSGAIGGIGAPTGTAATTLGRFGLAARASRSFFQYTSTQIGLNAILSGSAYLAESIANKGKISFSGFTASVISGAVSGRFSSGIRGMVNNIVLDFLTYQFGKFIENNHWY